MKPLASIKWRLQLWYAVILVLVLAGLGLTAWQLARQEQLDRIDHELQRRAAVLAGALHRPPPPGPRFDFGHPPPDGRDPFPDHPWPGRPENHPPPAFHLPAEDEPYFDASDPHGYYFRILHRDPRASGRTGLVELARSTNFPSGMTDATLRAAESAGSPGPGGPANPPVAQAAGADRQIHQWLPGGTLIEAGCSVAPEARQLRRTAWSLAAFGAVILLFGLAGGGWLVGRALRPIAQISAAATRISAGNLAERINLAETESELGALATVLNSTFARLESAFAQQRQFTADAAHELRTPVTVILTQAQTTLSRGRDAAGYRQALEACQRAAQRMRRLIESLLTLARLEAGQESLNRQRVDLARVVGEAVALLQPLTGGPQLRLQTRLDPVEVHGDADRLGQVAANLIANAIQHNRPGGAVRVELQARDGLAVLTVADSGPGIPPGDLARVFERFYRADPSRTGAGHAGLGLAICQAIITAHAGVIEAASDGQTGTTFTVRLPACPPASPATT